MIKFSEFIVEKINKVVNAGWTVLKLDDGTDLMTNMSLVDKKQIQVSIKGGSVDTIKLNNKSTVLKQIEKIIGSKLNTKDKQTQEFLELYPCECEV
jgi:ferritin